MSGGLKINGINSKGTELLISAVNELLEVFREIKEIEVEQKELLIEIKEALSGA